MAEKDRSDIENIVRESGQEADCDSHESAEARARREARRRVLAGGLASAPMILTLASRPAFAGGGGWVGGKNCGPSTLLSGNLSNNNEPQGCEGETPSYWKTHADKCGSYFAVGPCNPITGSQSSTWGGWSTCDDYSVPLKADVDAYLEELYNQRPRDQSKINQIKTYQGWLNYFPDCPPFGTPFSQIFGSGLTQNPYTTMMQALWLDDTPPLPPDGAGGSSPVLAHSAAAYCNARFYSKSRYGLSPQEVVDLVASMILVDPEGLKDLLEAMNSRSSS
jgi:hypothetical protein